jgi:hypothetical protein
MKKHKVFYKKRLMRNSITAMSILIAVAMVLGSGVSAIDLTNETIEKKYDPVERPDALAPETISTLEAKFATNNQEMSASINNNNYQPVSRGEYMYGYAAAYGPSGEGSYKWDIEDPGTFELLGTYASLNFLAGGTYSCEENWWAVEYANGALYEVDTETGELTEIGGGGTGLNGLALAYDTNTLYGCSSYDLWLIDPETGAQEVIGSFGTGQTHIGLAYMDGIMYSWDVKFSGNSYLYTVDLETGEATQVGSMDATLLYAQDGDFLRAEETLYLTAWVYNPVYGGYQCTVDHTTGELTIGDGFDNNCEVTASMFMNGCIPPEHDVGVKEITAPEDGYAVDPVYPQVLVKNYGNHSEVTDVQFEVIKCEAGPLLLEEGFDTWVPAGWTHYAWYHSNTNNAVGTPPEIKYTYPPYYSNGWVMTPAVNASGFEKINVKFRMLLDRSSTGYSPYFYLHYRKNSTSPWRDASPWDNPVSDLGPEPFEIGCYGWGEDLGSEFQVRWYWGSPYYYLQYGSGIYIDDVVIEGCAGCAEYAELVEDAEIPWDEEVLVDFPGWTPSEWHNPEYQDTWEEYPLTAYTLLEDNNSRNDKKQRLLSLYYPWLHDVGALNFDGPESGPAQTFPVETTIKNVGQYEECCFKVHVEIAEIDFDSAELLEEEYFNSYIFPPTGWTRTNTKWSYSYSSYAGGSPYEARFYYYPSETGMFRLYTPPIDTTGFGGISIEFKHYVNHYTTPYTLRVETSADTVSWSSVWDIEPSGGVGPEDIQILTGENVGDTTYVSWTFDGYSWNINYWYVDNIVISGIPVSEPEYEDQLCVEAIVPGEEILYQFNDWTPAFLAEDTTGVKTYNCKAWTSLEDPPDNNLANDAFSKNVILDFFHDVEVTSADAPFDRGDRRFYACEAGYPGTLVWFDPEDPSIYYDIGTFPSNNFPQGATFVKDIEWVVDTNGNMYYGEPEANDWTAIGNCAGSCVSLAYDPKTKTMYGMSTSALYEVDMDTGDETMIGSLGTGTLMISCDFGEDGILYGYDLGFGTAQTYTIDTETGHATAIGGTGVQLNYGQDMAYDKEEKIMYACAFNYGTFQGELHTIDLDTGAFTKVATLAGGAQTTCFAIPGGGAVGIDVYVQPGVQNIEATVTNVGTFPELDMTCYAEIQEFITNCTNGTTVYEDMIDNIDLEEPLGGSQGLSFEDYNFAEEGAFAIFFTIVDDNDDNLKNNVLTWGVGVDDTPPVSTHELDPADPDGLDDYYISDITVTLTAFDPTIGCEIAGSDVKEIRYSVDGDEDVLPGAIGTFDITEDGNDIEVEYWAIDFVGNVESKNSFTLSLDKTVPDIEEVEWEAEKRDGAWWITFTCDATDATAGMDRVEMYINEGLWATVTDEGPTYTFEMEWSSAFETVMFTFIHYDDAGWFTEDELYGGDISSYPHSQTTHKTQQQITPI